jgi:pSer/pThr/pTyr-binding forkhead associated (FHA) protein
MPGELFSAGGLTPGLCLFGLLWAGSIAAVYWDLRRRRSLPVTEQTAWVALAALLPGLGMLAYLLFKALGLAFPLPSNSSSGPDGVRKRRVTLLRPVPEAAPRTGTIAASDLVRETVVERPPVPPPGVRLAVVAGAHAGQVLASPSLPARLGRGSDAALRLDRDQGVSREHAEIYWQQGGLHIRDLGSTHGTSVNGRAIQDAPLVPGDKIEMGLSTLVVQEATA